MLYTVTSRIDCVQRGPVHGSFYADLTKTHFGIECDIGQAMETMFLYRTTLPQTNLRVCGKRRVGKGDHKNIKE